MSGRRYAPEYKTRMVELVRAGRSADQLAREFEPSATAIRRWVERADLDEGRRTDGLTTAERKEVRELKRELRRVKIERDILANVHDAASHPAALKRGAVGRCEPGAEVVVLNGAESSLANMTRVLRGIPSVDAAREGRHHAP